MTQDFAFLEKELVRPINKWNGDLSKAQLTRTSSISGYIVYGVALSDDGTKLYFNTNANNTAGTFYQYDLTTPFNCDTKTNVSTFNFGRSMTYGVYSGNITFRNDGKYLYLSYGLGSASYPLYIEMYELTTPRDTRNKTLKTTIQQSGVDHGSVSISKDGAKLIYSASGNQPGTWTTSLSTPYYPQLGTKLNSTAYQFMWISPNGEYMYNDAGGTIYQYKLSTPRDVSTLTQVASLGKQSGGYGHGIHFNSDGTKLYAVRGGLNSMKIYEYSIS